MNHDKLTQALKMLGEILENRNQRFDLVVIGGGALLLQDLIQRPTLDLDAVALVAAGKWVSSKPLPEKFLEAVRDVAEAFGLPYEPRHEKDWINGGPSMLLKLGLPEGFEERAQLHHFGALTLRVASRIDLIFLKLWSATSPNRGRRRDVDVQDIRAMKPTHDEILRAVSWCAIKDGRSDFVALDAAPVLRSLGFEPSEFFDD